MKLTFIGTAATSRRVPPGISTIRPSGLAIAATRGDRLRRRLAEPNHAAGTLMGSFSRMDIRTMSMG